jgi:hypothetical protein
MYIKFTNATVKDHGYGLTVNGESLEDIISTMLGTKLQDSRGKTFGLKEFESNCCNVTVIIDTQPELVEIKDTEKMWTSVKGMEAYKIEQFEKENAKTAPEE